MLLSFINITLQLLLLTLLKEFGADEPADYLILLSIFSYSFILMIEVALVSPYKKYGLIILIGLSIRIFFLIWSEFGTISFATSGDGNAFLNAALDISRGVKRTYGGWYTKTLGFLFSTIGYSALIARFYSIVTSMVTILVMVHILEYLDINQKSKKIALLTVCIFPNYAMLSAAIYRETTISMFLTISLYFFLRWFFENKKIFFLFSIILSLIASIYHSGSISYSIAYAITFALYDHKSQQFVLKKNTSVVVLLFGVIFVFLFNNYNTLFFSKIGSIDDVSDIAVHYGGGSSYLKYVGDSSTIFRFIAFSPLRMVYYLFSPFIWQWRGLKDIFASVFDASFYMITIYLACKYVRKNRNKQAIVALLICILVNTFIFGWGSSNTAQAMRHRSKSIMYYGVLLALSLNEYFNQRATKR